MNTATPKTIPDYLDQLRYELRNADPALLQDALYDAEEYLRSEMAENPEVAEAEMLARIATSYGAPEEVAAIYRDTEVQVSQALRTPRPSPRRSTIGRFFGVAVDPRAWAALFYMLLSLATGIVYFTTVVTGASLSAGFAVLIIGIPVVILFIGLVRMLSLVEGRLVEVMLGERMPRRPLYVGRGQPLMTRIGAMFTDPRTWSTMLYMLLMLPLGIVYFTVAVTAMSVSLGLIVGAMSFGLQAIGIQVFDVDWYIGYPAWWEVPVASVLGVLGLFLTLHLARAVGKVHGLLAKHLLVKTAQH